MIIQSVASLSIAIGRQIDTALQTIDKIKIEIIVNQFLLLVCKSRVKKTHGEGSIFPI